MPLLTESLGTDYFRIQAALGAHIASTLHSTLTVGKFILLKRNF